MTTLSRQVAASLDDCEEKDDLAVSALSNSYVYVGVTLGGTVYDMGLRWLDIDIPRTALIVSAKLSLFSLWGTGVMSAVIRGVAEDDTPEWSQANRPSMRSKTSASKQADTADWSNWGDDLWGYIDISDVVQEIVDRELWVEGNALAVVIEDDSGTTNHLESVRTYDYAGNVLGAKLEIVFTSSPSYKMTITDLDGAPHVIEESVEALVTVSELTSGADTFVVDLANVDDVYDFVVKECPILIEFGMGSTAVKFDGYVMDVQKSLRKEVLPMLFLSGEDWSTRLDNIFYSGKFEDLEVSALIHELLGRTDNTTGKTYYELTGLTNSSTYLQATSYTIGEVTYVWRSIAAIIKGLAEAVGYEWKLIRVGAARYLEFFDPGDAVVSTTISDGDLDGTPTITDVGAVVNRAIVIGGFEQVTDKTGNAQSTTYTVKDTGATKNQSFVPSEDFLSSVLVYTELVSSSESDITISIQSDSGGSPDGVTLSNGRKVIKKHSIADGDYTEFRFKDITLVSGDTYWMVLMGSTSDGVKVGVDGGGVLDYVTRYPVRVAVMVNDNASQIRYGSAASPRIFMRVFRDEKIEDPQFAETIANEMMMPEPKKVAVVRIHDHLLVAGDVVRLVLSKAGVAIDKVMEVRSSRQVLGNTFIYNNLTLEEI